MERYTRSKHKLDVRVTVTRSPLDPLFMFDARACVAGTTGDQWRRCVDSVGAHGSPGEAVGGALTELGKALTLEGRSKSQRRDKAKKYVLKRRTTNRSRS